MPDLAGLRLALTTFTVLPVKSGRIDRRAAAASMAWSPLVGAALAAVAAGVLVGARQIYLHTTFFVTDYAPLLSSALAVMCLALLTRGLHLDGLADTVDGLASHKPAEQALAIMSDGPIGALGAAALFGCLLIDVLALGSSTLAHHGTQSLLLAVVTGRLAMLWSCTPGVPAARHHGLGALVAGSVPRTIAAAWTAAVCAGAAVYGRFDTEVGSNRGAVRGVVAVLVALGVAWVVRRHAVRRLGGITGDVLGALCEIATMTSLLVTAASTR
ncbi:MAG: adenosylcobinamide-GDP ribazoletransferase [Actinomycetota bacterium]|nr:adenosylcobinamide-GDP ribazoletransferase [Actinomycetota bacterium]